MRPESPSVHGGIHWWFPSQNSGLGVRVPLSKVCYAPDVGFFHTRGYVIYELGTKHGKCQNQVEIWKIYEDGSIPMLLLWKWGLNIFEYQLVEQQGTRVTCSATISWKELFCAVLNELCTCIYIYIHTYLHIVLILVGSGAVGTLTCPKQIPNKIFCIMKNIPILKDNHCLCAPFQYFWQVPESESAKVLFMVQS